MADKRIADSVKEILNGLRCYFDKALPRILLYKSERYQYQKTVMQDMFPSDVYGAEHLLRLFGTVIFEVMFNYTSKAYILINCDFKMKKKEA